MKSLTINNIPCHKFNFLGNKRKEADGQEQVLHNTNFNKNIPTEFYRAYAMTSPSFKSTTLSLNSIDLLLSDEKQVPRIRVDIVKNSDFESKSGLFALYHSAVHDQLHNVLRQNIDLEDKGSFVKEDSRRFDISCPEDKLIHTLKMIQDKFINIDIKKQHIDEAQKLVPVAYRLHSLGLDGLKNYDDVPEDMSQQDYEKMINEISYEDVKKYNEELLDNSDIKITLSANREFYNNNKKEISSLLGNFVGK